MFDEVLTFGYIDAIDFEMLIDKYSQAFLYSIVLVYVSVFAWKYFKQNEIKKACKKLVEDRLRKNSVLLEYVEQLFKTDLYEPEKLYLNEKYLRIVKLANRNIDSKSVVDRATKKPLEEVLYALRHLNETNMDEIRNFVIDYLHEPGYEIDRAQFVDWQTTPKFVHELENDSLKEFSLAINRIWLDLYKKFDITKLDAGCVSSHLPMKHPFVVPGGRFIEIYYWDTYWTIEGLLVCGMFDTVRQMIENFIYFIEKFGFIPNGSRVYYLNRSQPPYFTQMCMRYYEFSKKSKDLDETEKKKVEDFVLNEALDYMIREYDYWMENKSTEVTLANNQTFKFNIYKAHTKKPRPESYFEDLNTAKLYNNKKDKRKLFMDIASGAESGYDFSSRWFNDFMNMNTISTSDIIPVDLNSLMYKNELTISKLTFLKGDLSTSRRFRDAALQRKQAINELLWSDERMCWADYNMGKKKLNHNFYVSNLSPLWMDIRAPGNLNPLDLIERHKEFIMGFDGGVPVSTINNREQWDFPNVWAPLMHSLVFMIIEHDYDLALQLAKKFFNSVYNGWKQTGNIYEKYNVLYPGERGSGGEYEVQSGFGWTNGVILSFIHTFKDNLVM